MKAHRIVLYILDHDEVGSREITKFLESDLYPNHCIQPVVGEVTTRSVGRVGANSPLLDQDRAAAHFKQVFLWPPKRRSNKPGRPILVWTRLPGGGEDWRPLRTAKTRRREARN